MAVPTEPVRIRGDRRRVAQILDNLFDNAVKYSPRGSTIVVRVTPREGDVVLAMIDEGQGIADEELDSLFVPFAKASSRPTGGEPSTSLGLAIVRQLVEAHGGQVWIESELGAGTTVSFSLLRA